MWCFEPVSVVDFSVSREDGFIKARQYALNLCDYLVDRIYQELLLDMREASRKGYHESLGFTAPLSTSITPVRPSAVHHSGASSTEGMEVADSAPPERSKHSYAGGSPVQTKG